MPRLFVAIDLPENVRDNLGDLYEAIPGAKWTNENQLHLTLRFLGDVSDGAFDEIDSALSTIKFDRFEIKLKSVGFFPPRGEPRVLWCGVEKCDELMRLRSKIERVLTTSGGVVPDKQKFHPHITVARLNNAPNHKIAEFIANNNLFETKTFEVSEFCLYSSILKRDGALHIKENSYGF